MTTNRIKELFWELEKGSTKWSGYFDVYERHLKKFVGKAPRILEIGVLGGGSIEMWLKYFGPDTSVVAIDINEECLKYEYDGDVEIVMGDQSDPDFWNEFLKTQSWHGSAIGLGRQGLTVIFPLAQHTQYRDGVWR